VSSPGALVRARRLVPLLFGAWSLWLGVDANWDLYNYHLYNPFAFLHGKLAIDLAPAGLQSYFNPLLDVPYYFASRSLPAPVVAFAMGTIHGFNFVLLLEIARHVLAALPDRERIGIALALSVAGVLTANFLSELGNTMGDDATALFVLGALCIVVASWNVLAVGGVRGLSRALLAGIVLGLGFGLKLTNGIYAVALCASLLFVPARAATRLSLAFVFGLGVLAGFAATGGFWMHEMWTMFGNPLFPQFSAWFPNPLTRAVAIADAKWPPKGVLERLGWPFIFSLDSRRVGQVVIHQAIWPVVYVLFFAWAAVRVAALRRGSAAATLEGPARLVVAFVAISYVVWMWLFSIARYLVPAELLAPLVAFVFLAALAGHERAPAVAAWLIGASTALVLAGGVQTWGHEGLAWRGFRVDVPEIARPSEASVVLVGEEPPWAWLAPFFPDPVSFAQVGGNFLAGPAYRERLHAILRNRAGPHHAILRGARDFRRENVARANGYARRLGLTGSEGGCAGLRWAVKGLNLHARVVDPPPGDPASCELALRPGDGKDVAAEDRREQAKAQATLSAYGLSLDAASCRSYRARVGTGVSVYQWCTLSE
jgi:hypothetical protein